jgi:hypothetical protein
MAQEKAKKIGGFTYGIEEVGGTNVIYVLKRPPEELGLPKVYKERISTKTERLVSQMNAIGLFGLFVGATMGVIRWIGERKNKILGGKGGK